MLSRPPVSGHLPEPRSTRRAALRALGLAFALGGGTAQAGVIDLAWDAQGHFDYTGAIAAGGMLEVCGPLVHGERIAWRFDSSAALPVNVHYHVGEDVSYPAQHAPLATLAETLAVSLDQTYCWMWENGGAETVRISVGLERLAPVK